MNLLVQKSKCMALSVHSYGKWVKEYRDPKDMYKVPYFGWKIDLPYGVYLVNGKEMTAHGTYIFPFAIRYLKEYNEEERVKMGVKVQPHSSNGVVRAYTLNHAREEIQASLDKNREDSSGDTGVLTLLDGTKKVIRWEEITFMRDFRDDEK